MKTKQTQKEEAALHAALDLRIAQFITATGKLLSQTTVMELIMWSGERVLQEQEKDKPKRKEKRK